MTSAIASRWRRKNQYPNQNENMETKSVQAMTRTLGIFPKTTRSRMISMKPVNTFAYMRSLQVGLMVSCDQKTGVANISTGEIVIMRYAVSRVKAPIAESSQVMPIKKAR